MAANDQVQPAENFILEGDSTRNRPVSEALLFKYASSINLLLLRNFYTETVEYQGYLGTGSTTSFGPIHFENQVQLQYYSFAIDDVGDNGTNKINFNIYDDSGLFVNTLFTLGTEPEIDSVSNDVRIVVGRESNTNPVDTSFEINPNSITVNPGTLNLTTIPAKHMIVPFMVSAGRGARGMRFTFKFKEV